MTACNHNNLILLPQPQKRLRCRHCYLTITADELGGSDCPECFDKYGIKRNDFEEMTEEKATAAPYRCEECGAVIKSG
jgi:hypothetical protein